MAVPPVIQPAVPTPIPSFEALAPGSLVGGRYEVEQVVGQGGMATVYRAVDSMLRRTVAVKVLNANLCRQSEFVDQFLEMERRVARLYHPNLVTIFDADVGEDGCYVVMEYVPAGSLGERLRGKQGLTTEDAIRVTGQVADALHVLHRERILHGDIKPDNILLDDEGNAKLVDFGIARIATTTGLIATSALGGTVPYLAPEQIDRGQADARTDLYSLGLVAYEALAGRKPFEGDNWVAVATQRLARDPVPLSVYAPSVPRSVESVIMRALSREAGDRYQSADAFRRALQQAVDAADEDPEDFPPSATITPPVAAVTIERRPRAINPASVPLRRPPGRSPDLSRLTNAISAGDLRVASSRWVERMRASTPRVQAIWAIGALLVLLAAGLLLAPVINPPKPVVAPALVGAQLPEARATAKAAGLDLRPVEEPSDSAPAGVVMRQDPSPNTTTRTDRPLQVVVSSGPPPVRVPDLRGRELTDARSDLAAAGLTLGNVEERESARDPWGVVMEQRVRPSVEISRGSAVDVLVAVPPWTTIPRLTDRSIGDADDELKRRGLRIGQVRLAPDAGKRAGTVLVQQPAADVRIRQGEAVTVTIAVPPSTAP